MCFYLKYKIININIGSNLEYLVEMGEWNANSLSGESPELRNDGDSYDIKYQVMICMHNLLPLLHVIFHYLITRITNTLPLIIFWGLAVTISSKTFR